MTMIIRVGFQRHYRAAWRANLAPGLGFAGWDAKQCRGQSPKIKRFVRIQGSPESRKRDYECSLREAQSKRCCPKGQNANKLLIVLEPHLRTPCRPAHPSNFFSTLGFYMHGPRPHLILGWVFRTRV